MIDIIERIRKKAKRQYLKKVLDFTFTYFFFKYTME